VQISFDIFKTTTATKAIKLLATPYLSPTLLFVPLALRNPGQLLSIKPHPLEILFYFIWRKYEEDETLNMGHFEL